MLAGLTMHFVTVGIGLGLAVLYPEIVQQFNAKRSATALVQGLNFGLSTAGGKKL